MYNRKDVSDEKEAGNGPSLKNHSSLGTWDSGVPSLLTYTVLPQTSKLNYFISTLVFAFAPAIGVGIAFVIGHLKSGDSEFDDFPLQILQGGGFSFSTVSPEL